MKKVILCFGSVLLSATLTAFLPPAFAAESSVSKPVSVPKTEKVAEGANFIVTMTTYKPGEGAPLVKRPTRVVYAQTAGTLQRTYEDGSKEDISFKKGETKIIQEVKPYSFINTGKTPLVLYIVRNGTP